MNHRNIRIAILLVLGTGFAYKLYKSTESSFFLDEFMYFFIGLLGFGFLSWTILKDTEEHQITKKITSYLPTLTGITYIIMILGINSYQKKTTNAPTLLKAFYDGGYNGFSIDLKENGNYIMANGSGLGEDYFYGTYSILDSIIILDNSNVDNFLSSNKFVIRNSKYFPLLDSIKELHLKKANYITQIDTNGKEIDTQIRFRIIEDNRK
jgi:hypothetical protein